MSEDLERLERLAATDLEARRAWAMALKRKGNSRARLIELTIEPGASQWRELCKLRDALPKEDQIAAVVWLNPLLSHWQQLYLNYSQVSDARPLANLTNLTSLSLGATQVSDVRPLANLTNLKSLSLIHISEPTRPY